MLSQTFYHLRTPYPMYYLYRYKIIPYILAFFGSNYRYGQEWNPTQSVVHKGPSRISHPILCPIPCPISCKLEGHASDSLSDIQIKRLHTNTIFHPIPRPISCCLGPIRLLQSFPKFNTKQKINCHQFCR
jgi:hypothetical protein